MAHRSRFSVTGRLQGIQGVQSANPWRDIYEKSWGEQSANLLSTWLFANQWLVLHQFSLQFTELVQEVFPDLLSVCGDIRSRLIIYILLDLSSAFLLAVMTEDWPHNRLITSIKYLWSRFWGQWSKRDWWTWSFCPLRDWVREKQPVDLKDFKNIVVTVIVLFSCREYTAHLHALYVYTLRVSSTLWFDTFLPVVWSGCPQNAEKTTSGLLLSTLSSVTNPIWEVG